MIYLLKLTACSALFLLTYLFLLQREKMFGFNRVFLLTGLILPFFIPLMAFDVILPSETGRISVTEEWVQALPAVAEPGSAGEVTTSSPVNYLFLFYLLISAVLFIRFAANLLNLWRNIRSHEQIPFLSSTLVLLDQPVSPHSFMGYILVSKEAWQAGCIDQEILYHEHMHGKLFHSMDILLVEFLQVFCWFNPVLYFYKRVIGLNHEFEVDDRVMKYFNNPVKYLHLLINYSFTPARGLSHSFNFIHLKKRIRMISARPNSVLIPLKTALAVIFTGCMVFLFGEKTFAQQSPNRLSQVLPVQKTNEPSAKTNPEEFEKLASKVFTHSNKGESYHFTPAETNRLGDLYAQMTDEERAKQKLILKPKKYIPAKANPPTKEQFESFKDPKVYGIWLDGRHVPNHILNKYQHTDFVNFSQSTLLKTAIHYGQYKYHLELSTPAAFRTYVNTVEKDTSRYVIWYGQETYKQIRAKVK